MGVGVTYQVCDTQVHHPPVRLTEVLAQFQQHYVTIAHAGRTRKLRANNPTPAIRLDVHFIRAIDAKL